MKSAPIPMHPRSLEAAYRFKDKTFVWKCDRCAKMFFLEVEEALADGIPRLTLREFASHSCELRTTTFVTGRDDNIGKIIFFPQDDPGRDKEPGRE